VTGRPAGPAAEPTAALLEVRELTVRYRPHRRVVTALDGVSIDVARAETVGLVGESGSGKSTLGRAILGLAPVESGSVRFGSADVTRLSRRERRALSSELQVVFQDPFSSLNPMRTVGDILTEPLIAAGTAARRDAHRALRDLLDRVRLPAAAVRSYASELSGGQRQRVAIARALIRSPRLIVCDEPLSALDTSTQAQIMNLLIEIQESAGVAYLFISHDIGLVRHISHRVAVLCRGTIVEHGDVGIVDRPQHPYTRRLLASVPAADPAGERARRQQRQEQRQERQR